MTLVDTSVWIDHLRHPNPILQRLLKQESVLCHPMIIGEIAMGNFKRRPQLLSDLSDLPSAKVAAHGEVLHFISQHVLYGIGIGYIDSHLLAASAITRDAQLWTGDKRLREAAVRLGLDYDNS